MACSSRACWPDHVQYTHGTVPIAVVTFRFDPYAHLFDGVSILWGTIALVVVFVAAMVMAGLIARADGLREDDVIFIAIGIVPGAVIGGRLEDLLLHGDDFASGASALLDPSVGGLGLGLAVVGGFLTGTYVASLLEAPVGRWLHLAAIPVLFALGAGKLTMVLTGTGQGLPSDEPFATAYLGPGPWGSLLPALPSEPSQAYEGIATMAILVLLTAALLLGAFKRHDGRLFFVGIGTWAIARAVVSTTWRDPAAWGGINAGGLVAVAIAIGCALVVVALTLRSRIASDPQTSPE
jgi:prolipoprotein diacylglyceryltransferase